MGDSSPISNAGSAMGEILTPRTKIARAFAEIDEEIDNAPTPSPSKGSPVYTRDIAQAMSTSPAHSNNSPVQSNANSPQPHPDAASDSDDEEDSVRKPQGRAAQRMLQKQTKSSPERTASSIDQSNSTSEPAFVTLSDEDDLYSATPMKRTPPKAPDSPSPRGTESGNGLFVSPAKSADDESDDDLPSNPFGGQDKLAELVAQKRAERLAKEAEERDRKQKSNTYPSSELPDEAFQGAQDPVDPNIEKIMSDATRPSRKASKKALLEMERETQRMARQQALAHQMKVKKKFTTNDLFAKFNFRQQNAANDLTKDTTIEGESSMSSAPNSDGIEERAKEPVSTPPSSPPTPMDKQKDLVEQGALSKMVPVRQESIVSLVEMDDDNQDLLDMVQIFQPSQAEKANSMPSVEEAITEKKGLKLARLGKKPAVNHHDSSDDELDIVPNLPPHLRAFEKATGNQKGGRSADSRAVQHLKHLAHLHGDDGVKRKKGARPSVDPQTLDGQLRRKAKEQARKEQIERIEELKAKGIDVQTTEEREKEAEAFENLLEKARQDAVKLREAEKAAKKAAKGESNMEASEDEDDEDYEGSGSEEEVEEDEDEDEEGGLIDDAADETNEDEEDAVDEEEEKAEEADDLDPVDQNEDIALDIDERLVTPAAASRKPRKSRVVMDDDDEDNEQEGLSEHEPPHSVAKSDDPFAAFNFDTAGNANLLFSPTQAFHATMQTPTQMTQEDSFDILRRIAPPSSTSSLPAVLPGVDTQTESETPSNLGDESQVPGSQRVNLQWETQAPETPVPAHLSRGLSGLSETPGWEPSPDPGLASPLGLQLRRERTVDSSIEHETQSTVRLRVSESPAASQQAARKGRLVRRKIAVADDSDGDDIEESSVRPEKKDVFREMRRRRKEALTAAERAEADKETRGMMDEQAEESEDEYAGLGGDDYVAPETEQDKEMIDSSIIEVDERALAAHYAERQRVRDEAEINQLYKDVTTGVLRKRMGANAFDLEEDEDELAARRRQMRQQEEARKRKALLKDVNVASLAKGKQSKGKDAFLRAIADDEVEDDVANLSDGETASTRATQDDSQTSQSQHLAVEPLRETSGNKRRHSGDDIDELEDAPRTKQRRTQQSAFRRPTSLVEVKESVVFLLEEPNAGVTSGPTAMDLFSDPEEDEAEEDSLEDENDDDLVAAELARNNDGGFAPNPASMEAKIAPPPRLQAYQRRTISKTEIVDRLSLKRSVSNTESAHNRTAWAAGPTTGGFKVPTLLRRATTSNVMASGANERGVSTPNLSRENSGVKMGGTKKSSLAYQARAEERKAIVEASARRREESRARIAQLRRNSSALNRGLTGRFE